MADVKASTAFGDRWIGGIVVAAVVVGAPVAAYVSDEVPLSAVVLGVAALVAALVLLVGGQSRAPQFASLAFRGLFLGLFLELTDAVFRDSDFSVVRVLLIGVAFAGLTAAWERFADDRD